MKTLLARLKHNRRGLGTLGIVLVVLLILILVGALPAWNYSHHWGYGPSGAGGLILLIIVILILAGRL